MYIHLITLRDGPDYFNEVFSPVDNNGVTMCCCNKKLKLPFHRSKLGMQSLLYVGPSTWNKLSNNLKTATSINCFKHDFKQYFLKKLGENEAVIYSQCLKRKLQNQSIIRVSILFIFIFSMFKYSNLFQCFLCFLFMFFFPLLMYHFSQRTTMKIKLCSFFVLSLSP